MKKLFLLCLLAILPAAFTTALAQNMQLWRNGKVIFEMPVSTTDSITFDQASTWTPWACGLEQWELIGQDPAQWPLAEGTRTATFFDDYFGEFADLRISYRQSTVDPTAGQFKIDNVLSSWDGTYGVDLIVNYNTQTHACSVASQLAVADEISGDLYISDYPNCEPEPGSYDDYPCSFDPLTGTFDLNLVYYDEFGVFTDVHDFIYCNGYPNYSVSVEYVRVHTEGGKDYAVVNANFDPGVALVKAVLCSANEDTQAVADAIAEGTLKADTLIAGTNTMLFPEGLVGNLKVVAVSLVDGKLVAVATSAFKYYGLESKWVRKGVGQFTDDIFYPLINKEMATVTYDVEYYENPDWPGVYRVMDPFAIGVCPYAEQVVKDGGVMPLKGQKFLTIDASDPEGVYIESQDLGINIGFGSFWFETFGALYISSSGFEATKKLGYLGTLKDGVITFPAFYFGQTEEDGIFQGLLRGSEDVFYTGRNGVIQFVLPGAKSVVTRSKVARQQDGDIQLDLNQAKKCQPNRAALLRKAKVVK